MSSTATVSSAAHNLLHTESLPLIDLRLLSQSELLSLSFCSSTSSSLNNKNRQNETDVSTLKIDRSVFNESAGSRKQTFYKLRLAPRKSNFHFSPSLPSNKSRAFEIPKDEEGKEVAGLFKKLFGCDSTLMECDNGADVDFSSDGKIVNLDSDDNLISVPITYNESYEELQKLATSDYDYGRVIVSGLAVAVADSSSQKKKRGRPRQNTAHNDNVISNEIEERRLIVVEAEGNSVSASKRKRGRPRKDSSSVNASVSAEKKAEREENVLPVSRLDIDVNVDQKQAIVLFDGKGDEISGEKAKPGGGVEDWYGEELRKRTLGMQTEEEILGFMEGLEGEWGTKRKKRKIVDVSVLGGDMLPKGWKLIVSNKRRAGIYWVDCSGYISPNGKQFTTYKEVSSHLLSKEDAYQSSFNHIDGNIQSANMISFGNAADPAFKGDKTGDNPGSHPTLPGFKTTKHVKHATETADLALKGVNTKEDLTSSLAVPVAKSSRRVKQATKASDFLKNDKTGNDPEPCSALHFPRSVEHESSATKATDSTVTDGQNGSELMNCPTLLSAKSAEHEKQATSLRMDTSGQVQTFENYKCHKCTMVCKEPDELLQHLLSVHPRASKKLRQGSSMNEEAIIKNGMYECQFCRKTFEGRHRYNGHLGNHIKDYFKRFEASLGSLTIQRSTEPPSVAVHSNVLEGQGTSGLDSGSVNLESCIKTSVETGCDVPSCEIKGNSILESYSGQPDVVRRMNDDNLHKTNEVIDVGAVEPNVCLGADPVSSNNDNSSIVKSSDGTNDIKCLKDRMNMQDQEHDSQKRLLTNVERNQTRIDGKNERDSNSGLHLLYSEKISSGGEKIKERLPSSMVKGVDLDEREFSVEDKLRTDFENCTSSQKDVAISFKEQRISEGGWFVPYGSEQRHGSADNGNGLSTSSSMEMTLEKGSKGAALLSSEKKTCVWNNKMNQGSFSTVVESKFDELDESKNNVQAVCFVNKKTTVEDAATGREPDRSLGSCSVIPAWNEQARFAEIDMNRTYSARNRYWQEESQGSQLDLFGGKKSVGFGNTLQKSSTYIMGDLNHEVQQYKNHNCSKDADGVVGCQINFEPERGANNFLLGPSGSEQSFPIRDKGVSSGASRNLVQDRNSERLTCNVQKFNNESNVNVISFITADHRKNNEAKSSYGGEPHHVFHHSHMGQDMGNLKNTVDVNYMKGSSHLISGHQQKFSMEKNDADFYRAALDEQKRASIESLFGLSSDDQVLGVERNSNRISMGKAQEKPRVEDFYPRRNEPMIGFSGHTQASENCTPEFMWRTEEENDLLSSFADTSQLVHSSSCFPTYDVMSDKGESDLFSDKFSSMSGFEGLRSGTMENMEYNFMTSHSDESKVFSYGADVGQGLDSSVWLDKEAMPLLPKMSNRRQICTFCVWCKNEIRYEALENEAPGGFICAACKAKYSGQFNLL